MKKYAFLFLLLWLVACSTSNSTNYDETWPTADEYPVVNLPLTGAVSGDEAEISGLAWYGDTLILLPQYPPVVDNALYGIAKADIEAVLAGELESLTPLPIPLEAPNLDEIPGFEGFEAIVFDGDTVYLTVEASAGFSMQGYVLKGTIAPDLSQLVLDTETFATVPPGADISNYSEETAVWHNNQLLTLYEANGVNVNDNSQGHWVSADLATVTTLPFEAIEYRVTDATAVDSDNRFWVMNFNFPGSADKLDPATDPLFAQYGIGETHRNSSIVERLVEYEITDEGIIRTETAPILLQLQDDGESRNWEGVARLDEAGFVIVTDKFPQTILGFVAHP